MELSQTEENYLKAIWALALTAKAEGVSTNDLAAQLSTSAASVTEMLKRLAEKKLIHYEKYKGVQLSAKGQKIAVGIVRKHRLWEVFLLEKLKFSWDQVHDIAEQLEHIKSEELIERLDAYLGHPRQDPHGDPIPDLKGHFKHSHSHSLSQCSPKSCYVFTGVSEHSAAFLQYLTSIGLKIGDEIRIQDINSFDRSVKVRINKKHEQFLSEKISIHLLVEERR